MHLRSFMLQDTILRLIDFTPLRAGAAASYLYHWVPSLGWGRARRSGAGGGGDLNAMRNGGGGGGGSAGDLPQLRRPLSVRTQAGPNGIAGCASVIFSVQHSFEA